MAIESFKEEHSYLSNFWPCSKPIHSLCGRFQYPTVEHAFVSAKTFDPAIREEIQGILKPGQVKRFGRKIILRPDWEIVRVTIMEHLVREKFGLDREEHIMLLATGDQPLVEGNWWGDCFWGVCRGKGENKLGKILMKIRNELTWRKKEQAA